ncbi:hypothetical protein KUTeg_006776 [Tegillarca granosa]|uniref:Uncharacterized protein n=1 Tax=Tegillarca granosa TaxID=220873 RepID=A0ABQ9FDB1_TEGGR|nr:hypothetical protein KUTeg_006776 [Tegillarca granosa]
MDSIKCQEVDVKMNKQQKNMLNRILPEYVSKIEENLSSRFSDCGLLSNMHVLTHECICSSKSMSRQEFSKFGKKEVAQVSEQFAEQHDLTSECVISEYVTYRGIVVVILTILTNKEKD